jgi:hypothetical protein
VHHLNTLCWLILLHHHVSLALWTTSLSQRCRHHHLADQLHQLPLAQVHPPHHQFLIQHGIVGLCFVEANLLHGCKIFIIRKYSTSLKIFIFPIILRFEGSRIFLLLF